MLEQSLLKDQKFITDMMDFIKRMKLSDYFDAPTPKDSSSTASNSDSNDNNQELVQKKQENFLFLVQAFIHFTFSFDVQLSTLGKPFKDITPEERAKLAGSAFRCSNGSLALLGNSIISTVLMSYNFQNFPGARDGVLFAMRSLMSHTPLLNRIAGGYFKVNQLLQIRPELSDDQTSIVSSKADALKAVVGALYMSAGFDATAQFIADRIIIPALSVLHVSYATIAKAGQAEAQRNPPSVDRLKRTPPTKDFKVIQPVQLQGDQGQTQQRNWINDVHAFVTTRLQKEETYVPLGPDPVSGQVIWGIKIDSKMFAVGQGSSDGEAQINAAKMLYHKLQTNALTEEKTA